MIPHSTLISLTMLSISKPYNHSIKQTPQVDKISKSLPLIPKSIIASPRRKSFLNLIYMLHPPKQAELSCLLFPPSRVSLVFFMGHLNYNRVGSVRANRGFRLNPRRFSVSRLRARFLCFFKFLSRWRCLCMTRTSSRSSSNGSSSTRRGLVREKLQNKDSGVDCGRLRSFGRSNSFYAEAIADCLEFIKRSSVSVDQRSKTTQ